MKTISLNVNAASHAVTVDDDDCPNDTITYDGFGNVTNETDTILADRWKYTDREFGSKIGLHSNRARYLDHKTDRWTSQDPLGFDSGDANLFRYVDNRPTNALDPFGLDVISEKDAPKDVVFSDEVLWQSRLPSIVYISPEDKEKNQKAVKAMMDWRDLKNKCYELNVYYVTDDNNGPVQFLSDAVKKGAGSINLFFGHGSGFDVTYKMQVPATPGGQDPPLFGIASCYASQFNGLIPEANLIANAPTNKFKIKVGEYLTYASPMILEADRIIRDRIKNQRKVQLNLYFGEFEKRVQDQVIGGVTLVGNTSMYGKEPVYRYRQWK